MLARWALAAFVLANVAVVVVLWATSAAETGAAAGAAAEIGRLCGLLGALLVLTELLLLARLPLLERAAGFERLIAWHRWNGRLCVTLLVAHARADRRRLRAR